MKGKDMECCGMHMMKKGIGLVVLGVLVWLNATYAWLGWWKFVGLIIGIVGLIKFIKSFWYM